MAWQFTSSQPIYLQIVDQMEMMIFRGSYPLGERLPSVRDLALEASVNPNTMQRALSELEGMGLINTQRTSGRTVTTDEAIIMQAKNEKAEQLTEAFLNSMSALGLTREQVIALLARKEEDNGSDS